MKSRFYPVARNILLSFSSVWMLCCVHAQAPEAAETPLRLSILDEKPEGNSLPGHYAEMDRISGYQWVRFSDLRRDLGQSMFMRENAEVSAISIHSNGNIQPEAYEKTFQLELWESERVDRLGERLNLWDGTWFPRGTLSKNKWIRFAFPTVSLKEGFHYTFILRWKNMGPRHVFTVTTDGKFAGGRRWQSADGETHTSTSSHSLFFQLESDGELDAND